MRGMKSVASFLDMLKWQRVRADLIEFKSLNKEIYFLIGYSILYIFFGYLIGLIIVHSPLPILGATQFNQDVWYSILFKIVLLLIIPAIIYFRVWRYEWNDLQLGIRFSGRNCFATLLMVTIGFFLNASHLKGLQENMGNYSDASLRLALGIAMPLVTAALPEELFFRGYLQTRLEKKWNRIAAILISSFLFTAWHLPSRYLLSKGVEGQAGDWGQVILHTGLPVFIIGVLFAFHWSRHRNIVLLIATHWAIDTLPSLSSYFKIPY
jgi:uncharacterized protein